VVLEPRFSVRASLGGTLRRLQVLAAHACVLAMVPVAAQEQAGMQAVVTDSGTPSASYPLSVPPGIGGMSPKLALVNSGGGVNGPEGVGWSLGGISTITRCPGIVGTDGARIGSTNLGSYAVRFAPSDKLCLDGQRLIQTNASGTAGAFPQTNDAQGLAAGSCTEFRTEKDMYARILGCGTAGSSAANGPAYFKVWTKSGLIYEYGVDPSVSTEALTNAQIAAQGTSVIAVWAVSRVSDTVGNYMDFMYEQRTTAWGSGASGAAAGLEWNVLEIQYTGNTATGQKPTDKVVFTYSDRPVYATTIQGPGAIQDRSEAYHAGSKNVSIRLLQAITTYVNWTGGTAPASPQAIPSGIPAAAASAGAVAVKTWVLSYNQGPVTNRSRLASIAECAGGPTSSGTMPTTCLPPTQFAYTAGGGDAYVAAGTNPFTRALNNSSGVLVGDFNGDGKSDVITWNGTSSQLYFSNGLVNGAVSFSAPIATGISDQLFSTDGCLFSIVADFNGDGVADILRASQALKSDGTACASPPPNLLFLGNPNGTGSFTRNVLTGPDLTDKAAAFSVTPIGPTHTPTLTWTEGRSFYLIDVDGDGILDIVTSLLPANYPNPSTCPGGICTHVWRGNGSGGFTDLTPINVSTASLVGNFSSLRIWGGSTTLTLTAGNPILHQFDANGDGLGDIFWIGPNGSVAYGGYMSVARGDGNFDSFPTYTGDICQDQIDFNGDGRQDCLVYSAGSAPTLNPSTGAALTIANNFGMYSGGAKVASPILFSLNSTTNLPNVGSIIGDLNGDGRDDILVWNDNPTLNKLYVSNGDGTFHQSTTFNLTAARASKSVAGNVIATSDGDFTYAAGDFTGRGSLEILTLGAVDNNPIPGSPGNSDPGKFYVKSDPTPADVLQSVTSPTGSVTTFSYAFLTTAGPRYVSDRAAGNPPALPVREIAAPIYLVTDLYEDVGVGNVTRHTQYTYTSLRSRSDGRGPMGFRNVQRQTVAPNGEALTSSTDYVQSWPYTGVAWRTRTFRGALGSTVPVSEADYVYCEQSATPLVSATLTGLTCPSTSATTCTLPSTTHVVRPYLNQSSECGWDLGGTSSAPVQGPQLPKVTTTYSTYTTTPGASPYTSGGDPEVVTVTTAGTSGFGATQTSTKTTTNQYLADNTGPGYWLLGRLASTTVQNAVPNMGLGTSQTQLPSTAGSGSTAQSGTSTSLTVTASPTTVAATSATTTSLSASTSVTVSGSPTPPLTFTWTQSGASGAVISESGPASSTAIANSYMFSTTLPQTAGATASATWQVAVADSAGRTGVAQVPVSFGYQPPALTPVTASPNPATGSRNNPGTGTTTTSLNISGGVSPYTVNWVHTSGTRIAESGTTTATFTVTLGWAENLTETYTATVTDSAGQQQSVQVSVTFSTPPQPTVTLSQTSVTVALNKPGTASASVTATASGGTGGFTYAWAPTSGSGINYSTTGSNQTFSANMASLGIRLSETFQVTATDSAGNAVSASVGLLFTTPSPITASVPSTVTLPNTARNMIPNSHPIEYNCVFSGSVSATGVTGGTGGYTYAWSVTNDPGTVLTGATTLTVGLSQTVGPTTLPCSDYTAYGTLTLTITDSAGNTASKSATIN
jgi:hypothetical protein